MSFKDKFVFASIAFLLASIWCGVLYLLVSSIAWLSATFGIMGVLFFIGFIACLRAIGEMSLWENDETKPIAEAKFKYGHLFRGMWF